MSETSTVLPPALSAIEYVSARMLFRASFFSRLACRRAAFSSNVSISLQHLHQCQPTGNKGHQMMQKKRQVCRTSGIRKYPLDKAINLYLSMISEACQGKEEVEVQQQAKLLAQ